MYKTFQSTFASKITIRQVAILGRVQIIKRGSQGKRLWSVVGDSRRTSAPRRTRSNVRVKR